MPADVTFQQHEKLLRKMAHQFHRRALSAGAKSLEVSDVFQEMCIAWCQARDKYDPANQVPFVAYLVRGIRNHTNRWLGKEIWQSQPLALESKTGDDDDGEIHDVIADANAVSPEAAVIENDDRSHIRALLSAEALKFVEILENPPPALFTILDAMRARREFAVERGLVCANVPNKISANMVFDLMGIDKTARGRISRELRAYGDMEITLNG